MSDPEAEYLAAKEAFLKAQERLTAAKLVMEPIWKARKGKRRLERLAFCAEVLQARLISGKWKCDTIEHDLWSAVLSHEEIYHGHGDFNVDDWERRVTLTALQRYRERIAA